MNTLKAFILLSYFTMLCMASFGEGTKELMPNSSSDTRILIARGTVGGQQRDPFAVYNEDPDYRLYIHIIDPISEKIYFGLGQSSGAPVNWRIHAPDGSVVWPVPATPPAQTPVAGQPGFINTYTEAYNGPNIVNPAGYDPLFMQPTVSGDYYMTFEINNGDQRDFRYFDISVVNTGTTPIAAIPGRVYSKCWQIRNPSPWSTNRFYGLMYIYSSDGIVTKLDPNGLEGRDFSFSSNESGCYQINPPTITSTEARRSQVGRHTYPQFNIFLNDPDTNAFPSGIIGELIIPPPPAQAIITTTSCANGTIEFSFSVSQPGSVQIDLMLNAALGAPYVDRQIVQQVNKFGNIVIWDGFDGAIPPNPVPNNTQFNFSLTYINGMTHLPLYDVEGNSGGFRVYLVRPPSSDPKFYWDDIHLAGGTTNLTGCQSSPLTTCHPWGISTGDQNTVNTWWYVSNTSTVPALITEKRLPGVLGTITGPVEVCEGTTHMYSVLPEPSSTSYSWTIPGNTVVTTDPEITIDFTGMPPGPQVIKVQGINDCGGGPKSVLDINIHALPIASIAGEESVCLNTAHVYTTQPGMSNYSWNVSSGGTITAGAGTDQVTVLWTTAGAQTLSISYDDPFGCGVPTPFTANIIVNPIPTVNTVTNQTLCNGSLTNIIEFSGDVPGTVFTWTNTLPSIGIPASGSGNIIPFNAINASNAPVTATITVTPTFTNLGTVCPGPTTSFSITVNPTPVVNAVTNQVVCHGGSTGSVTFSSNVTGTTYTWANSNTAIGLSSSGNGGIPSFIATNLTTAQISGTITVTPTFSGGGVDCAGPPLVFTITVSPVPTVDNLSNQVVCHNTPTSLVQFTGDVPGTVFNWTNTLPSIGLAATGSGNINAFTATNTSTAPVTATITVTPVFTSNGVPCQGATTSFTITVNPVPTVAGVANQVLCNQAQTSAVTFAGNVPGTVFNWTNSLPSIGLTATGTGNIAAFQAVNTGNAPVTANLHVTPVFTNLGVTCQGTGTDFTYTVNPTPTVNSVPNQSLCHTAQTSAIHFTGNVAGTIYNWSNDTPSIGLAASGSGDIAPFTATNPSSSPVTATITVTPLYTNLGTPCTGTNTTFTITVYPTPTISTVNNQALCHQAFTQPVNFSGSVAGTSFTWTNTNPAIGLAANGTGNIAAFQATNTTTAPATATITVTPNLTTAGVTCTGSPTSFTITVNPIPTVNSISSQTLCHGSQTSLVPFSGNVPATVFNWTNTAPSIGLAAAGTGDISPFTATNNSTAVVTATISVTPQFTNAGASCQGTAASFTISVNPNPLVVLPASPPNPQNVCSGSNLMIAVPLSTNITSPGITYAWTAQAFDDLNNPTAAIGGFVSPNAGNAIPGENLVSSLLSAGYVNYTVQATLTSGGLGCTGTPVVYRVNVNPSPTAQPDITSQSICSGTGSTQVNFTANVSPVSFSWTAVENVGITGAILSGTTSNIPVQTLQVTAAAQGHVKYEITPIYTGGGTFTCPGGTSFTVINVNPLPPVPVITGGSGPGAGHIECENQPGVTYSVPAVAGQTYQWSVSGGTITGSSTTNTITVNWGPANPSGSVQVSVTDGNYTTNCQSNSALYAVNLTPRPVPGITANNPAGVCQGLSGTYTTESGMSNYAWTIPPDGVILAGGNGFNYASIQWTAPGSRTIYVNYTNTYNCDGLPPGGSYTLQVHPLPDVTFTTTSPATVCQDFPLPYTYATQVIDPTFTYNWSILSGSGIISPAPSANPVTVSWPVAGTAQLKITATTTFGCTDSRTLPVTVKAKPNVTFNPCFERTTIWNGRPILLKGGLPAGTGGNYSVDLPQSTPVTYYTPNSLGSHSIYYNFTNDAGCIASSSPVTINVLDPSSFFTSCGNLLTDRRETPPKTYETVLIGGQCWMKENLTYGSTIPYYNTQNDNCIIERYCLSADNANCSLYGGMYQWDELMQYNDDFNTTRQGLCPPGWHVPTEAEWAIMVNIITGQTDGRGIAGNYLKDLTPTGQFLAKPAGIFYANNLETFTSNPIKGTFFWTSTPDPAGIRAIARGLNSIVPSVGRYESSRANAFPVRCIKD